MVVVAVGEDGDIHRRQINAEHGSIVREKISLSHIKKDLMAGSFDVKAQAVFRRQIRPCSGVFQKNCDLHDGRPFYIHGDTWSSCSVLVGNVPYLYYNTDDAGCRLVRQPASGINGIRERKKIMKQTKECRAGEGIGAGTLVYRQLGAEELERQLFAQFIRRQKVVMCRRRENGEWVIRKDPFVDDWTEEDYGILINCLQNTLRTGGFVYGAFFDGVLKGFTSVEATLFGGQNRYLDLSCLHVSEDMRGRGIGRVLFGAAAKWAGHKGAGKLYISAHSAVETQAFYQAMGCAEAQEYNQEHVEKEPYDCQLEYRLEDSGRI